MISNNLNTCPLARSRGRVIFIALFAALFVVPAQAQDDQGLNVLQTSALPVESIGLDHRDMSDLEPLIELIGDRRVVALGEGSHGAGSDFRAKGRIIRFLHERMGFDVILWEAGMYDMRYLNSALVGGADALEAATSALYSHWAYSEEVISLLEYIQYEQDRGRPIHLSGFDLQISAPYRTPERFIGDILDLFSADGESLLTFGAEDRLEDLRSQAAEVALFASQSEEEGAPSERFAPIYKELAGLMPEMLREVERHRDELHVRHSPRLVSFMERMFASLDGIREIDEPLPGDAARSRADFVRRWNHREIVNTENISWLVDEYFPDRRIIIWAHNAHIVEGYLTPDFSRFTTDTPPDLAIRPSGAMIRRALGDELFSMAFTAYKGSVRRVNDAISLDSEIVPLQSASGESLEGNLHRADFQYAILPLRDSSGPLQEWLDSERYGRIDTEFLSPQSVHWPRVVDALFFVDTVEPSTLVEK